MNSAVLLVPLLLLLGGTAALEGVCPAELQVEEGDTAEFRCQLDESVDLRRSAVAFSKDGKINLVHRYTNGQDNLYDQIEQFKNRTWLSHKDLATGKVLLRISRVQQGDAGRYTLRVRGPNSSAQTFDVDLKVVKKGEDAAGGGQEPTTDPPHTPMDGTSTSPPDGGNKRDHRIRGATVGTLIFIIIIIVVMIIKWKKTPK